MKAAVVCKQTEAFGVLVFVRTKNSSVIMFDDILYEFSWMW